MNRRPDWTLGPWPVFAEYRVGTAEELGLAHRIDVGAWVRQDYPGPEGPPLFIQGRGSIRLYDPLEAHERGLAQDPRLGGLHHRLAAVQTPEDVLAFAERFGFLGDHDAFDPPGADPMVSVNAYIAERRFETPEGQQATHTVEVVGHWLLKAMALRDLLIRAAEGRSALELNEHVELCFRPELVDRERGHPYGLRLKAPNLVSIIEFFALADIARATVRLCRRRRCGRPFTATRRTARYCSEACRKAAEVHRFRARQRKPEDRVLGKSPR